MGYLEMTYKHWDMIVWFLGRCFFWVVMIIAIGLFLCWLWESVIEPGCEAINSAWWRLTKRCPECGSTKHQ